MVAERSDEKLVLAESHRGRASAQRVEGAYAVDPGHEVELKAIAVACNAVELRCGIEWPKHDCPEILGDSLQLRQVVGVLRNMKSKSMVVTGEP